MGDDVADVVGMARIVLHHHTHDATNKLDIRRERPERPEDRRDAQLGVVEPFAERLHLNDAIESAISQCGEHFLLLFWLLFAMDDVGGIASF